MTYAQLLVIAAVMLQSLGNVLYGALLPDVSIALFLFAGMGLTSLLFLPFGGWRLPEGGIGRLVPINLWTAASFISFFVALRYFAPAAVAAVDLGVALATALVLARLLDGGATARMRLAACFGILAGCAVLFRAEIGASAAAGGRSAAEIALAAGACAITGIASALCAWESKVLANAGWSPAQVLAHRFHLSLVAAGAWLLAETQGLALPAATTLPSILLVAAVAVILPLFLLQVALRRCDTLTVMIGFAAEPILTYLLGIPAPGHRWDVQVMVGVVLVTACLALDIVARHAPALAPPPLRPAPLRRAAT